MDSLPKITPILELSLAYQSFVFCLTMVLVLLLCVHGGRKILTYFQQLMQTLFFLKEKKILGFQFDIYVHLYFFLLLNSMF